MLVVFGAVVTRAAVCERSLLTTLLVGSKRKDNGDGCYKTVYLRIVF